MHTDVAVELTSDAEVDLLRGMIWKYVGTKSNVIVKDDACNNEGRAIFSIATMLSWSDRMHLTLSPRLRR